MVKVLSWIKKAIVAGLLAGGAAFYAAYPDGISSDEWAKIVAALIIAGVGVFFVPNRLTPN